MYNNLLLAKNQCPPFQAPANGGAVCLAHRNINTERCQVKCNPGFDHLLNSNMFEMCGPDTLWQWSTTFNNYRPVACTGIMIDILNYVRILYAILTSVFP